MFDRLEDLVARLDELQLSLSDPSVISDQDKFRRLMKEQADLSPIVEKYLEYKNAK
ncbi:MAG: PCRF domain-containing protein, partial [Lachnospiraceae bacterium]|nr:PCRF domain-containing protein [Lachnospiraceae bacterium]